MQTQDEIAFQALDNFADFADLTKGKVDNIPTLLVDLVTPIVSPPDMVIIWYVYRRSKWMERPQKYYRGTLDQITKQTGLSLPLVKKSLKQLVAARILLEIKAPARGRMSKNELLSYGYKAAKERREIVLYEFNTNHHEWSFAPFFPVASHNRLMAHLALLENDGKRLIEAYRQLKAGHNEIYGLLHGLRYSDISALRSTFLVNRYSSPVSEDEIGYIIDCLDRVAATEELPEKLAKLQRQRRKAKSVDQVSASNATIKFEQWQADKCDSQENPL